MIRVLVISSDTDGVGYYRTLNPHLCMDDKELKIDIRLITDFTLPLNDPNFLRHYNVIFYNKIIPFVSKEIEDSFYENLKKMNIKLIYDLDDYWVLDSTHLNYKNWKVNNSGSKIEEQIAKADVVTTTTPIFADRIREINPNVVVLENALNITEQQWISDKRPSDKVRFIWGGGISHMVDLRLITDEFKKFDKHFLEKSQLYLCGYDLRIKMPNNQILKDDPKKSQWGLFESMFTHNYKYVRNMEHYQYLLNSSNFDNDVTYGANENFINEFYQRRHTKPILLYGTMYNEADVSIAPLKNNHGFNRMKSELKIIESGCHKMPIILSNYGSYTLHDVEGTSWGKQKGWLIDEKKNNWYEKMKWYVDNPSAIKEHGEANHEYFLEKFEMNVVNKKRSELYKTVASQNRTEVKL
jgi:hypothetical protein